MFFLELLFTDKCNVNCYYCSFEKNNCISNKIEVDIDLLNFILKTYTGIPLFLEISGGEPGLVSNLTEVFYTLLKSDNCKKIQIMSNGLFRTSELFSYIFDCKDKGVQNKLHLYNEHLIYDIIDDKIIKHYPEYDFLSYEKYKNIVILTPNCINNISTNTINQLKKFSIFKVLIPNTIILPNNYSEGLIKFNNLKDPIIDHILEKDLTRYTALRSFCSRYSHNPSISFQQNKIVHCTLFYNTCYKVEITKDNLLNLIKGNLFDIKDYCNTCMYPDIDIYKCKRIIQAKNNKKYQNRSFGWYW